MQSKATTVEQYLASLPEDRRAALSAIRKVILANLDKDISEGMQYGMIGYAIPHSVFPHGYHCDPRQPLPFAGLASQKGHMSLYLMCVYGNQPEHKRLAAEWKKAGKKLDMGKACIRFKKLEDVPLDVIGAAIKRNTANKYIEGYVGMLASTGRGLDGKKLSPAAALATTKIGKPAKPSKNSATRSSHKVTKTAASGKKAAPRRKAASRP